MRMSQEPSETPPTQRSSSPPIPSKPTAALRKKTLAKKSAISTISALPQQQLALSQLLEKHGSNISILEELLL